MPMGNSAGPRSSRLKDKKKGEGETVVKELFVQNVVQNNELLHILGKGSSIVLLPRSSSDISVCSKLRVGSQLRVNPTLTPGLCSSKEANQGIGQVKNFLPVKGKFGSFYERFDNICSSNSKTLNTDSERGSTAQGDGLSDQRLFSCVTCGILSFACVAIVQPRDAASRYLMTADCSFLNDWTVGSGITGNGFTIANGDAITSDQNTHPGSFTSKTSFANQPSLYDLSLWSSTNLLCFLSFATLNCVLDMTSMSIMCLSGEMSRVLVPSLFYFIYQCGHSQPIVLTSRCMDLNFLFF